MKNDMLTKALKIAKEYGLEYEVREMIESGYTPYEALKEWDLLPLKETGNE